MYDFKISFSPAFVYIHRAKYVFFQRHVLPILFLSKNSWCAIGMTIDFFFFETKIYWLYSFFKVVSSMRLGQKVYIEKKEGKMLSFLRDSAPTVVELVYAMMMVLRCLSR